MMMKVYDGGPAFPQERTLPCGSHEECEGLSMRDYFAAQALTGICANQDNRMYGSSMEFARACYRLADAMIAARRQ
jgi:hypothetical protein